MAKSFPSAPNTSIVQAQQIVAGGAGPSRTNAEWAKANVKRSTTHGASRKEVVVFSSPPVHWNTNPVVLVINSLLGQHKKALH